MGTKAGQEVSLAVVVVVVVHLLQCELVGRDWSDRDETSGGWHLRSDPRPAL